MKNINVYILTALPGRRVFLPAKGGERKAGRNQVSRLTKPAAYSILSNGLTVR